MTFGIILKYTAFSYGMVENWYPVLGAQDPRDLWNPWNMDAKNSTPSDPLGHQHLRTLGKILLPFEIQNGNI